MRSSFKFQKWIILLLSTICGATFFSYAAQIDDFLELNERIVIRTALVGSLNLTSNPFNQSPPWIDCIFDREASNYKRPYHQVIQDIINTLNYSEDKSGLDIKKLFGIEEWLLEKLGQQLHQKYWKLDLAKTQTGKIRIELTLANEKGEYTYLFGLITPTCVEDLWWPRAKINLAAEGNSFAEAMNFIFGNLGIK